MVDNRPIVLTIGGLDPSAGAGLLADIKTMEEHKVYGLGICTAITIQTETEFLGIKWEPIEQVLAALEKMLIHYSISSIKIGIVENMEVLEKIIKTIKAVNGDVPIILDPVIRSSTGFTFWEPEKQNDQLISILSSIFLLTPNYDEMIAIDPSSPPEASAKTLSSYCNILLKGGHNIEQAGVDYLFTKDEQIELLPTIDNIFPKHGSGCVLSSSIASNVALGYDLITSCKASKDYIEQFLLSNESLLGYHHA